MAGSLGASGGGFTVTIDGKPYTFAPFTQGVMEAFESWLIGRVMERALTTGELLRRKARKLERELNATREYGMDQAESIGPEERARLNEEGLDKGGEMQALQLEAREMVNRINERAAAGYYHFYGPLGREARGQIHGMEQLFFLTLQPAHPRITLREVSVLGEKHWQELARGMAEANGEVPNEKPAAGSTPSSETTTTVTPSTVEVGAETTQPVSA